jgi:prepilin-type N-terminal cleavage/methylation domain-containing protein
MCSSANSRARRAFTLLEVIIATMIVGMMVITLYRFLSANLTAMRVSTELTDEREAVQAVVRLIESQLNDLPLQVQGALTGRPLKFRGLSNDELSFRCTAGPGVLTTAAPGQYRVTLTVQPVKENGSETELGLRRKPIDPTEAIDTTQPVRGQGTDQYNWVPLIRPMAALEVRYFNQRVNAWQDTWNDPNRRPDLVRVRLWKRTDEPPVEAVLAVPSAKLQQ